jgi:subtilisin family serine protease
MQQLYGRIRASGQPRDVVPRRTWCPSNGRLECLNPGLQVVSCRAGIEILAVAPGGANRVTSGTSVAAAHASGAAALLLAAKPKLTPAQLRGNLIRSANRISGTSAMRLGPASSNSLW